LILISKELTIKIYYIEGGIIMSEFKSNIFGDLISKGFIWRAAIGEIKNELVKQGYTIISFPNFLDKEKNIIQIEEGKYEVKDVVKMVIAYDKVVYKNFIVTVSVIGQGVLSCKVDEFKILEEVS
jgi:hypothetical protein